MVWFERCHNKKYIDNDGMHGGRDEIHLRDMDESQIGKVGGNPENFKAHPNTKPCGTSTHQGVKQEGEWVNAVPKTICQ